MGDGSRAGSIPDFQPQSNCNPPNGQGKKGLPNQKTAGIVGNPPPYLDVLFVPQLSGEDFFYVSCIPPRPPPPHLNREGRAAVYPPDLNRQLRVAVSPARPQPQTLAGSFPGQTSTNTQPHTQPQSQPQTLSQTQSHEHTGANTNAQSQALSHKHISQVQPQPVQG